MPKMILDTIENEFTQFTREELKGFVLKYFRKLSVSQWKRERGATTFHIESSDLNAKNGFVFPLLNDGFKSILQIFLYPRYLDSGTFFKINFFKTLFYSSIPP